MSNRRLPVYIVADCSYSMSGAPIEEVKQGILQLQDELKRDPEVIELAYISCVSFSGEGAVQVAPLSEVAKSEIDVDQLIANGGTPLGETLELLLECFDRDLIKAAPSVKGDWKALVFLFTDGMPTDEWQESADKYKAQSKKVANTIALAAGPEADPHMLKQVTDTVLVLRDKGPEGFKDFFEFVTQSIKRVSDKCSSASDVSQTGVETPPLKDTISIFP